MWAGLRVEWVGLSAVRAGLIVEWAGSKDQMDRTKQCGRDLEPNGRGQQAAVPSRGRPNLIGPVGKTDLSLPDDIMGSNWQHFQRRR